MAYFILVLMRMLMVLLRLMHVDAGVRRHFTVKGR